MPDGPDAEFVGAGLMHARVCVEVAGPALAIELGRLQQVLHVL